MTRDLRVWALASALVGVGLTVAGSVMWSDGDLPPYARTAPPLVIAEGLLLVVGAIAAVVLRGTLCTVLEEAPGASCRPAEHPQATLFLVSFVALFLELALIRYTSAQFRVFAFYKNVPLIAAYLGLGLGCALGAGNGRRVLPLLLWLVPLVAWLSVGPLVAGNGLGRLAALASTEHILGDEVISNASTAERVASQLGMGGFCVAMLVALTLCFVPLGRLLGVAFERLPRVRAYTVNIAGSLAGSAAFLLAGWLWAPPWVWFLVGLVPLLWWIERPRQRRLALLLIALTAAAVAPGVGETIWSPYQKLVGRPISIPMPRGGQMPGYLVDVSDVFYQVAVDLSPAAVTRFGRNPFPHYDAGFKLLAGPPGRVLVVGAGTGNDVAAALRAGAAAVDAVDIDPAIVDLGRLHHPEHPYDDPRVSVIVDDARAAFRHLPPGSYDAVVFGLLDAHTQLGISSVRLDNYVFTRESFLAARRLLRPGGSLVVTAAAFRPWFRQRFAELLGGTCNTPVRTESHGNWVTWICQVDSSDGAAATRDATTTLPTDDWPFLYLPERGIPNAYLVVVALLALASLAIVRASGLAPSRFGAHHAHLFLLGAAFLLMEVYAINRLALVFGTTWIVSAVAIMTVLALIVAANVTVAAVGEVSYGLAYAALGTSLLASFAVDPAVVLGRGSGLAVGYAFGVLLPVYFAGLVFVRSFAAAPEAGPAIGVNMLGAVIGGWSEYATMAVGIRALALLALGFYAASSACLVWTQLHRRDGGELSTSIAK